MSRAAIFFFFYVLTLITPTMILARESHQDQVVTISYSPGDRKLEVHLNSPEPTIKTLPVNETTTQKDTALNDDFDYWSSHPVTGPVLHSVFWYGGWVLLNSIFYYFGSPRLLLFNNIAGGLIVAVIIAKDISRILNAEPQAPQNGA